VKLFICGVDGLKSGIRDGRCSPVLGWGKSMLEKSWVLFGLLSSSNGIILVSRTSELISSSGSCGESGI
jgi:hypothetical protein